MSDVVIRVENISKEYRLGTISYGTLYQDLQSGWAKLRGKEDPNAMIGSVNKGQLNSTNDRFCALKDVTFDVDRGDVVGIIGRNGAGKSTLLKIISRVTAPTSGTIKIKGRIASLLEVGTGFHPELTGGENIFLNGAILGMRKGEIEQKFDEIVRFAEIDKFIDTPVKRYSSGMYVRLAFAVAAHLEPEILVVDEVLAVGDAGFQKKCLGKMGEVAKEGRTVLFVSHNMAAIQRICTTAIMMDSGKIIVKGLVSDVIDQYFKASISESYFWKIENPSNNDAYFLTLNISDDSKNPQRIITESSKIRLFMEYIVKKTHRNLKIGIGITDSYGNVIFSSGPHDIDLFVPEETGHYRAVLTLPEGLLMAKTYGIKATLYIPNVTRLDHIETLYFSVHSSNTWSNRLERTGNVAIKCDWSVNKI